MRSLLRASLAVTAIVGFASAAFAGDFDFDAMTALGYSGKPKYVTPPPPPLPPPNNWTGFYVGGQGGGGLDTGTTTGSFGAYDNATTFGGQSVH